jgi:hypothetical protein
VCGKTGRNLCMCVEDAGSCEVVEMGGGLGSCVAQPISITVCHYRKSSNFYQLDKSKPTKKAFSIGFGLFFGVL